MGLQALVSYRFSYRVRHMLLTLRRGCVTPRQIANLKKEIENNLEYFDGYDTLPKDVQAKVRRALEVGHVSDAEWAGVSLGFLSPKL